ncbi:MAG: hypothetical protein WAW41_03500, partial [Methylobacter sp.]
MICSTAQYHREYVEQYKPLLEFYIKMGQWNSVSLSSLRGWLDNFPDEEGKYYAVRFLKHSLFYSEFDIKSMLRYSLNYFIQHKDARHTMLSSSFTVIPSLMNKTILEQTRDTLFVPLLEDIRPAESGNMISRILSRELGIPDENCVFHFNLIGEMIQKKKRIVIIDDNIGSGEQLE